MRHFINFKNIGTEKIKEIIDRAIEIKSNPREYGTILNGKKIYMLFQKTSTRTALSFAAGITDLGGSYFLQNWKDSNFAVGEMMDEVRYVGRNADLIMARLRSHGDIAEMAEYSAVPVINGCCDRYHPCQTMADMMTVKEMFGTFSVKLLYIGVRNNVFNSLAEALPHLGGELYSLTPILNPPSTDEGVYEKASETGRFHELAPNISREELKSIISDMDVIYTDTWVDMEYFNDASYQREKHFRIETMSPYQINADLLSSFGGVVMHDMPIHPGYEISRDIVERYIDTILNQAENRRHAQNAVMIYLLSEAGVIKKNIF